MLGRYFKIRKWFYLLVFILLSVPLLHLYDSHITKPRIMRVANDYELLSESCKLSSDVARLISHGQLYILYGDPTYIDRFNAQSLAVLKKELELQSRSNSGDMNSDLGELIKLTEDYVGFMQGVVFPVVNTSGKEGFINQYGLQYESLTAQFQNMSTEILLERHDVLQNETARLLLMENGLARISLLMVVMVMALLVWGTGKIILPLLINYHQTEDIMGEVKDAILIIDHHGNIARMNAEAEQLFQLPHQESVGKAVNEINILNPMLQNITQPLLNVLLKREKEIDNQLIYMATGQKVFLNIDYYPLFFMDKLTGAALIARPVEMKSNKRFLFEAIESERKKISIEIHDWIGRSMSPIIHSLDYVLKRNRQKMPGDVYADLIKLRAHCQTAAMDMRGIMNDIHPYLIDRVGLISALESYAENFEQMHGIGAYLFYQNKNIILNKTAEIVVYRIIQEALSNVVKHSNATEVDIYFKEQNGALKVEIIDNGDAPKDFSPGKGLWGMKERARLIEGDLLYGSDDGGFSLNLTVPLEAENISGG